MGLSSRDFIDEARRLGFYDIRVASVKPVDADAVEIFDRWLAEGRHASMDYMERYGDIRQDPSLLLPGARSILMAAMSYYRPSSSTDPSIAMYASGDDYHIVVRAKLEELAVEIRNRCGGKTRVCVDTAPLRERYWAMKAGLGFIGLNNQLIVPGAGSMLFIGAILTTAELDADVPLGHVCCRCRKCIKACPGGAILPDGSFDARRCLSYLTIEHRGPLPEGTDLQGHLYGCDECQRICPHNAGIQCTPVAEFQLRDEYRQLSADYIANKLTQEEFSAMFRNSAIKRTKHEGLRRNALNILNHGKKC